MQVAVATGSICCLLTLRWITLCSTRAMWSVLSKSARPARKAFYGQLRNSPPQAEMLRSRRSGLQGQTPRGEVRCA